MPLQPRPVAFDRSDPLRSGRPVVALVDQGAISCEWSSAPTTTDGHGTASTLLRREAPPQLHSHIQVPLPTLWIRG